VYVRFDCSSLCKSTCPSADLILLRYCLQMVTFVRVSVPFWQVYMPPCCFAVVKAPSTDVRAYVLLFCCSTPPSAGNADQILYFLLLLYLLLQIYTPFCCLAVVEALCAQSSGVIDPFLHEVSNWGWVNEGFLPIPLNGCPWFCETHSWDLGIDFHNGFGTIHPWRGVEDKQWDLGSRTPMCILCRCHKLHPQSAILIARENGAIIAFLISTAASYVWTCRSRTLFQVLLCIWPSVWWNSRKHYRDYAVEIWFIPILQMNDLVRSWKHQRLQPLIQSPHNYWGWGYSMH